MKLDTATIDALAVRLEDCELQARDTTKITDDHPEMDWEDAYAIQEAIKQRKLARGARIVGLKAGLTSHAKMKQMGVDTPVFGFLADYFALPDGGECKAAELIHPKVEPEIAFVTKADLRGPGCHIAAVLAAVATGVTQTARVIDQAPLLEAQHVAVGERRHETPVHGDRCRARGAHRRQRVRGGRRRARVLLP